jgi:putative membrane protein
MLLRLIINTFAIIITAFLLPGVHLNDFFSAILVAVVLGFLNIFLKPLLVILTIPVTVLTFGLFLLVINAAIILLAGNLVPGFMVDGFWWALGFSIVLTIVNAIFGGDEVR